MIYIKTATQIKLMQKSADILVSCHRALRDFIVPGITTLEIDRFVEEFVVKRGAYPEQKGYKGYKHATCTSVNDEVCHSIPSSRKLVSGDIVKVDMVINYNGWLADSAWTYPVGDVSVDAAKLMEVTKNALYLGINNAKIGNRIGDISNAIQTYVESFGYSVVRDYTGHGIGKSMHEDPMVPHFGVKNRGPRISEGMVFTIEPMVNIGTYKFEIDDDGWTARTLDGSLSAQYEHTIAVTCDGPIILTEQDAHMKM